MSVSPSCFLHPYRGPVSHEESCLQSHGESCLHPYRGPVSHGEIRNYSDKIDAYLEGMSGADVEKLLAMDLPDVHVVFTGTSRYEELRDLAVLLASALEDQIRYLEYSGLEVSELAVHAVEEARGYGLFSPTECDPQPEWCILKPGECDLKWCLNCGDSSTCEYDKRFIRPPTE